MKGAEEFFDKYFYFDNETEVITFNSDKSLKDVFEEFSQAQRLQARNEAIQECIDFIKDWYEKEEFEGKNFYEELEKLKTKINYEI